MKQDRLWNLVGKKLSGEASEEELQELEEFLRSNTPLYTSVKIFTELWNQSPPGVDEETKAAYKKLALKLAEQDTDFAIDHGFIKQIAGKAEWNKDAGKKKSVVAFFGRDGMWRQHITTAWLNLKRKKIFSFTNITGLAIGMAAAILLLLWIANEISFDEFHKKKDRLYMVYNRGVLNGQTECWHGGPMAMGAALQTDYPEIETATRVNWVAAFILKRGDKQLQEEGYIVDPGFLTMFDFPLINGDPAHALDSAHSIVITEKLSKKLFGDSSALGKTIKIDSNDIFTVTGVAKKLPNNTTFSFDYLVPWSYAKKLGWDDPRWQDNSIAETYVLLKPGITEEIANERVRSLIRSHDNTLNIDVFLHPLRKWRLWSGFENGKITGGNIEEVRQIAFIAAFILLIACINYMNLSTARNVTRGREVGVRKLVGAHREALIGQFIWESMLVAFIAGCIALLIAQVSMGGFNELVGKDLYIPYNNFYFWLYGLGFIIFTGFLAGIFPAFYLSAFRPLVAIQNNFKIVRGAITPRKLLVVIQFGFSITMIIVTIVTYQQIVYGKRRDPGYDMKGLHFIFMKGDARANYSLLRDKMLASGAVTDVTATNSPITTFWLTELYYNWKGKDPNASNEFIRFITDNTFLKTIGLKLVGGRDIDQAKYPSDSTAALVNETAAALMGIKKLEGQEIWSRDRRYHIVGIVSNFLPGTPYINTLPILLHRPKAETREWYGTITFRLNPDHSTSANLTTVENIFRQYNPDYPFESFSVRDSYNQRFEGVTHTSMIAAVFAGLAIFICCLGLFALSSYIAENRIKEIGVRKVLGASVLGITTLLSKDFLKLVLIAFIVASPFAAWAMQSWLNNFPYHVNLSGWVFAVTALLTLLIVFATISYQSIKAAKANPVKSLRKE